MSQPAVKRDRRYTYADYCTWNDDQRWEIIGGEAYLMSPSPTSRHQLISLKLTMPLGNYLKGKPCQLLVAPMDVVLSEYDVVQPDLLIVCDPSQILRTHISGPPTFAVEIMSKHSTHRDRRLKLELYARAGVREYWIVTPWPSLIEVLVLQNSKYVVEHVYGKEDTLTSPAFPGLQINLAEVFDFPLKPGEEPPIVAEPPSPRYHAAAH